MAFDTDEVYVGLTGNLYLGAVGSTLPAENSDPAAAVDAAFLDCGYSEEDGVSFKATPEIGEFKVWQETDAIRRSRKAQVAEISGKFVQHNEVTIPAAFGGGTVDTSGSFPTYTLPAAGDPLQEYAVVFDVLDGDKIERYVVPRMNAGLEGVQIVYNKDNMASLTISLKSLASTTPTYIIYNDAAAFAAAS